MTAFHDAQTRIRHWLFEDALPLWADRGIDETGRFREALNFDGSPVAHLDRRTRVQARQIAVFGEAARLGWGGPAEAIVARGLDRMIETCRRDDGFWCHSTDAEGGAAQSGPDLYDHAFVLFALAVAHRTLGDDRSRYLALESLGLIRNRMVSEHGGWHEALPPHLPRRQNPHMHMLEAMLAWIALDPGQVLRDTAAETLDLFEARLFDADNGALGEYFDIDWSVLPSPDGRLIEPGHHFEWVWLLSESAKAGLGDHSATSRKLYDRAMAEGRDTQGFALRELDRTGGVIDGGRRLWAQAEAVRAMVTMGDLDNATALIERIFDTHLRTDIPGLWIDSYDAHGAPRDKVVPASTLYHLMTAFSEVLRSEV